MPLRTVTVPEPVDTVVTHPTSGRPVKSKVEFINFVEILLNQKGWEANYTTIRAAAAIHAAFTDADPGARVPLAEEDWARLKKCIESPAEGSTGVAPEAARQLLSFFDAVMQAEMDPITEPKPKNKPKSGRKG